MDSPGDRPTDPQQEAEEREPKTQPRVDAAEGGTASDLTTEEPEAGASSGTRRRIVTLGDFEMGEKIGAGAMGAVYRARQISKGRPAAVKVLKPHLADDPLFLTRFLREAEAMARLKHPNIIRCYTLGRQYGRYYIAMELVEGATLGEWIVTLGRLSIADSLYVAIAVTRALQHAHQNGLIHRDIKPNNILITPDGRVKLADMGLARSMIEEDTETTQAGHGAGTPVYVAPEQAREARDADPRSDLYSLGCMFYQMLTGQLPFRGEKSLDVILAKIDGRYAPAREMMPELPLELDEILCRLLAAHPDERYQSATDLLIDLEHWNVAGSLSFVRRTAEPETVAEEGPDRTEGDLEDATDADALLPTGKRWYVQSQAGVEWVMRRLTTAQVLELMQDEHFAESATASLFRGGFRPLREIVEFSEAFRHLAPPATSNESPTSDTPEAPSPAPTHAEPPGHHTGNVLTLVALALALGFCLGYLLTH